jgi:20S proteasome alpha/beta subunit
MKKKDDIRDYLCARDAAALLSQKHGYPIRPDYISKMIRLKKYRIRTFQFGNRLLYHRADIEACTLTRKKSA